MTFETLDQSDEGFNDKTPPYLCALLEGVSINTEGGLRAVRKLTWWHFNVDGLPKHRGQIPPHRSGCKHTSMKYRQRRNVTSCWFFYLLSPLTLFLKILCIEWSITWVPRYHPIRKKISSLQTQIPLQKIGQQTEFFFGEKLPIAVYKQKVVDTFPELSDSKKNPLSTRAKKEDDNPTVIWQNWRDF